MLAIQLTTPLVLRKPCKLFASVARVCQRQLAFLVKLLKPKFMEATEKSVFGRKATH